jgi:SagB-type dehydrogenase family enzyme
MRLPFPHTADSGSFEAVLRARRSIRGFSSEPVSLAQVGQLLWAAQGVTGTTGRTAPSAGGLFPLSITLVTGNVDDLDGGVYRYLPDGHRIEPTAGADLRPALDAAAIGPQPWLANAALIIVIAADLDRAAEHFADQPPKGQRGQRYVHIEVGHVAQNVHLQATACGLGAVFVGGFDDAAVRALDPSPIAAGHQPLGLIPVGHIRPG